MAVVYPALDGLVVIDAVGPTDQLNSEVWRHAQLAKERGLALVVEIYARSVLASRRLTDWWCSGDPLMRDTLTGIYLLRVDLQKYGPEAVLRLTPYAVVGAPLFVGWNPVGQVCSRTQFEELTPESMALPLSAFVEDVLAGRPHSLNPVPSLGSAERTREAHALRRVGQAWLQTTVAHGPVAPQKSSLVNTVEPVTVEAGGAAPVAVEPGVSRPAIHEPETGLADAPAAVEAVTGADAGEMAPRPFVAATRETTAPELESSVSPLDSLLANARAKFGALEDRLGAPLRMRVADLQAVDQWVWALSDETRLQFAREFGAILAVYVGDTIRRHATADWVWEEQHAAASERLVLVGEVLGQPLRTPPIEWVVATLADATRSLYGQALGWCRLV